MKITLFKAFVAISCVITLSACDSDEKTQVSKTPSASQVAVKTKASKPAVVKPDTPYHNVSTAQLQKLLDQGVTLIDIRQAEEWKQTGVVPGSQALTFFRGNGGINPEFLPKLVKLADPNTPVALISETGNRTLAASRTLTEQLGYKQVYNVKDGIKQWIAEGRTIASLK